MRTEGILLLLKRLSCPHSQVDIGDCHLVSKKEKLHACTFDVCKCFCTM